MRKAMYRKGLGQIDFLWGTSGNKSKDFAGGWGISHILAKHGKSDVLALPTILASGRVTRDLADPLKRVITTDRITVVLVKENSRSAWVLTGYSDRRQVR